MAAKCLLTKLGSERLPLTTDLVEVARTASHSSLGPALGVDSLFIELIT